MDELSSEIEEDKDEVRLEIDDDVEGEESMGFRFGGLPRRFVPSGRILLGGGIEVERVGTEEENTGVVCKELDEFVWELDIMAVRGVIVVLDVIKACN